VPRNLDWVAAAAVPEVFITAHDALFSRAGLRPGETVLIHAAGSGVGLAGLQLAQATGALVIGTSRTVEKLARCREFGLDVAVVPGEDPTDMLPRVRNVTGGQGVNVILDLVGGAYFDANVRAAAQKGRLVLVSTSSGARAEIDLGTIMAKRLQITGTTLRGRSDEEKATAVRRFANGVVPLLARGIVRPVVDSVFPLDQVEAAHRRLESNQTFGKVILTI
jgi:NADPH2:quinone reductase